VLEVQVKDGGVFRAQGNCMLGPEANAKQNHALNGKGILTPRPRHQASAGVPRLD